MYDYVIVGSGLFGATLAYQLHTAGKRVIVIEKNSHIGGQCYTEKIHDIDVHKYGIHIFHTGNKDTWDFVNKFDEFTSTNFTAKAVVGNKLYNFPINLQTLFQVYNTLDIDEVKNRILDDCTHHKVPHNFKDHITSTMGVKLYTMFFEGYTKKQWGTDPENIPVSTAKRIPINFTFDDSYFPKHRNTFQGVPEHGYTFLIEKMLSNIPVRLRTNYLEAKLYWDSQCSKVIYTGPIDEFYGYQYGVLDYRSLRHVTDVKEGIYQGAPMITYPDIYVDHTRIIEHKFINPNQADNKMTVYTKEYSEAYTRTNIPYYPVHNKQSLELFKRYKSINDPKIIFGGRLGEYKYYDMDQTIESSIKLFGNLIH